MISSFELIIIIGTIFIILLIWIVIIVSRKPPDNFKLEQLYLKLVELKEKSRNEEHKIERAKLSQLIFDEIMTGKWSP